ncbi:hypothetical protein BUALT_BualtUnG0056700 [Buddleja alternifolia]|nr:hypothetical protein BUALT_BualtUnG0056700 [Buddleja alternifolia]
MSDAGKNNRRSSADGTMSTHTGGSRPFAVHEEEMDAYDNLVEDNSLSTFNPDAWIEACGGVPKGRVYGFGSQPPHQILGDIAHSIKKFLRLLHEYRWSTIAARLPGRTDNDIKNYWHAHIDKRGKQDAATVIGSHTNKANSMVYLEDDKPIENMTFSETNLNELASFDCLASVQDSTANPQVDIWPADTFQAYTVYNQTDYFTPISEEGFFYSEYHCSNLSNSDSLYQGDLTITSSDYGAESVQGDFWSEPFVPYTSNSQTENSYNIWPENVGGLDYHCLPYFDHGMYLF